jgi:hypothetical protein
VKMSFVSQEDAILFVLRRVVSCVRACRNARLCFSCVWAFGKRQIVYVNTMFFLFFFFSFRSQHEGLTPCTAIAVPLAPPLWSRSSQVALSSVETGRTSLSNKTTLEIKTFEIKPTERLARASS